METDQVAVSHSSSIPQNFQGPFSPIHQIADIIKACYLKTDYRLLKKTYQNFKQLTLEDNVWEDYVTQSGIFVWPQQSTWKESVGAALFFPPQALEWFDCPDQSHRLNRFDIIWGFAISAKFNHSLGKYLLVDTLFRINEYDRVSELPFFFQNYLTNTFQELESCLNHVDACYLLGRSKSGTFPRLVPSNKLSLSAYEFFSHSHSLRNQYHALGEMKETPPIGAYLELARQGYFQASIEAANLCENDQEKEDLLKEAAEKGYGPALLEVGYLCEEEGNNQQAADYYEEAATKGMTKGYVALGILRVGDPRTQMHHLKKDLSTFSEEIIKKAADLFTKAGNAGDPEGWKCLIALRKKQFEIAKKLKDESKKQIYEESLISAIQEGMKIGLPYAYTQAQIYFEEDDFLKCVEYYGLPLRRDLRMNWDQPQKTPVMLESVSNDLEKFLTES